MFRMMSYKKKNNEDKQKTGLQMLKQTHLSLAFNLINKYEPVSRVELKNLMGLSATAVSSIIDELLQNEMILEIGVGSSTTVGRKPIMLKVDPDKGYIIAMELKKDGLKYGLFDLKCKVKYEDKKDIAKLINLDTHMIDIVENTLNKFRIPEDKLMGITMQVPALFDLVTKRIVLSSVMPVIEDNGIYHKLKERFPNVLVAIGNYFKPYAEKEFGAEENMNELVSIEIGEGIGAGIISNGQLFRGKHGYAGELGHMTIDINGPKCKCGRRGCFEAMASTPAMYRKIALGIMSGRNTEISNLIGTDYNKINIDIVKKALDLNDGFIIEILDEFAMILSIGINSFISIFDPQIVIISGEIEKLGQVFLDKLISNIQSTGMNVPSDIIVRYSEIGDFSHLLGGAKYITDNIFNSNALLNLVQNNGEQE